VDKEEGREKFSKKYLFISNTRIAEKTIFPLYSLPCQLSLIPSLSCLNPNVKNLPLSAASSPLASLRQELIT
jgi:hypothetical protein